MIIMVSAASVLSVTGFFSLRGAGQGVGGGAGGRGRDKGAGGHLYPPMWYFLQETLPVVQLHIYHTGATCISVNVFLVEERVLSHKGQFLRFLCHL